MTINLRPYQQRMEQETTEAYAVGYRHVLNQLSTGGGKTWLLASQVANTDGPTCTIVHRQELLGQISRTYAAAGIRHSIMAPQPVINWIIETHVAEFGRSFFTPRSDTMIAGVDTLVRRYKPGDRWCNTVTKWLVDECFVAGTDIHMADGSLKHIETVGVGDEVVAFDETTGAFKPRKVTRFFKNPAPKHMVRLATAHHVLYATNGHPFWTRRGWVNAGDLQHDDEVYTSAMHTVRNDSVRDDRDAAVSLAQDRQDILHTEMRLCVEGCATGAEGTGTEARKTSEAIEASRGGKDHSDENAEASANTPDHRIPLHDLLHVRGGREQAARSDASLHPIGQAILQQRMFRPVSVASFVKDNGRDKPEIRQRADETKQSDEHARIYCKDESDTQENWTQAEDTRRQRKTSDQGGNGAYVDVRTDGVCRANRGSHGVPKGSGQTPPLQDRLRAPHEKDCNRSGRGEPLFSGTSSIGCEEGRFFAWQRLESVSVLEQGNHDVPGDGFVYNIEVDGLHTYIANGVVVHNCHHCLSDNKWGRACQLFPNALGYGVTATPIRADRRSLHVDQGGAFDYLVQGASMRDLIDMGSLVDYRVIAPQSSINEAELRIGSTGDFTAASQKKAQRAELFGDIVQTYLDRVPGKRAIVFTTGVDASRELCEKFKTAGARAMDLNGMTDDRTRSRAVRDFSEGRLDVLINTGLFDEGFDVPAVEVTIMARPTMSFGLFAQQIGRCLRPDPDNPGKYGIIIDHVGNVLRMAATHGMPDTPRRWKLWKPETERGTPRNPDAIPMRTCHGCGLAYEAITMECPFCGTAHEPASRAEPQNVAGILSEMSPELLERLRMARAGVEAEKPRVPYGASPVVVKAIEKRHRDRQAAHRSLAEAMEAWGGIRRAAGDDDAAMQARFYWRWRYSVIEAQTLSATDALKLRDEIMEVVNDG